MSLVPQLLFAAALIAPIAILPRVFPVSPSSTATNMPEQVPSHTLTSLHQASDACALSASSSLASRSLSRCCCVVCCACQTHEFYAGMTCDGCKNAITRIVTRIPGVTSMSADVAAKKVLVTGTASATEVEEKLGKWAQASKKELRYVKST